MIAVGERNPLADDLDFILESGRPLWEELRGEKLLFTGATGFVGSWMLESFAWANRALELDASAVVLTRAPQAFLSRHPHLSDEPSIEFVEGDMLDAPLPRGRHAFVLHLATVAPAVPSPEAPLGAFEHDVSGMRRMLDFARSAGTARFLYTSSGAVYGRIPSELEHCPEEYAGAPSPVDAGGAYANAKRVGEFMGATYARQSGFVFALARLFAFVGPWLPLDEGYAVGNFIADALARRPIAIKGDGTPYRSYLYAADLAAWLWTVLLRGRSGRPYNVGSSCPVSILELARRVARATGAGVPVETALEPVPGAAPSRYVPSTARAESELGLRCTTSLDMAIRKTYDWHRARRGEAGG